MSQDTIRTRIASREYIVKDYMWNRIKDIYKLYISSIKIRSDKYDSILELINIDKLKNKIIDYFFSLDRSEIWIGISDGMFLPNKFTNKSHRLENPIVTIYDILPKNKYGFTIDDIVYYLVTARDESKFKSYHRSRIVHWDYKGINTTICNYIKNACEFYERAINSAVFVLEHNNHSIVKLASPDLNSSDLTHKSSILSFLNSSTSIDSIASLDKVLSDTLITDQYKLSILGTEDEVVRLQANYSTDSYKTIKENLIAKCGVPYSILFGSSGAEDDTATYVNFYETINNFFKAYVEPVLKLLLTRIGFKTEDYSVDYLYYEDNNYRNKRLEVLSKSLDIVSRINLEGSNKADEIKNKILDEINNML